MAYGLTLAVIWIALWSGVTLAEPWRPAMEAEVTTLVDDLPEEESARNEALREAIRRYTLVAHKADREPNEYAGRYLEKLIVERFPDSQLAEDILRHLAWSADYKRKFEIGPGRTENNRLQRSLYYPGIASLIRQTTESPQRRHALAFLADREYVLLENNPVVDELIRRARGPLPVLGHAARELLAKYVEIHAPPGDVPQYVHLNSQAADTYLKHFEPFFSEVQHLLASDSAPHRELGLFGARLALGNPALFGNFDQGHETNAVREGQAKVLRALVKAMESPDFPRAGEALAILRNLPASLLREVPLSWIRAVVRRHPNADVARILMDRAGALPPARWAEVILAGLHHPSEKVRAAALQSLQGHLRETERRYDWSQVHSHIADRIRQLARAYSHDPDLQSPRIQLFLESQAIRDRIAPELLDSYLRANPVPEARARYLSRFTTGSFGASEKAIVLRLLTQDPNEAVRRAAAEVLLIRAAGDPSLLEELIRLLSVSTRDPSEALRSWLAEELYERFPTPDVRNAISRAYVKGLIPELPGPGLGCYRNFAEAHALFSP